MLGTDHEDKLREAPIGFLMSAAIHSEEGVCPQNFPSGFKEYSLLECVRGFNKPAIQQEK